MRQQVEVRELQEGDYVMIDDEPYLIRDYTTSQPGKHGSAKAAIKADAVFGDGTQNITQPVDQKIEQPVVERKQGQVINVEQDEVQVLDQDTYDTFKMKREGREFENDETIEFLEFEEQRKVVE